VSVMISTKSCYCSKHKDKIPAGQPLLRFRGFNLQENYCQRAVEEMLTEMKAQAVEYGESLAKATEETFVEETDPDILQATDEADTEIWVKEIEEKP
jgi:hypothetical protein